MANNSVSDFLLFINQQIKVQEQIESCIWQLEALITVGTSMEGFYTLSQNTLHGYLSVLDKLVLEISKFNQISLSEMLKQNR